MPGSPPQVRVGRTVGPFLPGVGKVGAGRTGEGISSGGVRRRRCRVDIASGRIGIDRLRREGVRPGGHRETTRRGLPIPKARRVGRGRHGGRHMGTPAVARKDMGRRVGGTTRRGAGESSGLARGRAGLIPPRIEGQPGPSVVGHDQRRRSTAEFLGLAVGRRRRGDAGGREVPAVTSTVCPLTARRARPRATLGTDPVCPNLALESRPRSREGVPGDLLVDVHRLGVLAQVIESGEAPSAVALEWALPGVFADVSGEMFTAGEAQVTRREVRAEEALALLLLGWRGVVGLVVGLVVRALSLRLPSGSVIDTPLGLGVSGGLLLGVIIARRPVVHPRGGGRSVPRIRHALRGWTGGGGRGSILHVPIRWGRGIIHR